jgi:nucleoid-associated protein YgaU
MVLLEVAMSPSDVGARKAYFLVESGQRKDEQIPFRFNPTEIVLNKQNTFAEIGIPGLVAPPIQYVRGASEKLTFDALVDTSDTLLDVRSVYVYRIRSLMNIDPELHAPPVIRFVWLADTNPADKKTHLDVSGIRWVLESLNVTYTLFAPNGTPLRAKLAIALKEFTTVDDQAKSFPKNSPDVEKTYVVRRGDTLAAIAEATLGDGRHWREIAGANEIVDPRTLQPGFQLRIPRLT